MDRLHAATINILNLADRWPERLPLLLADFAALQPDVLAMQEVVYVMQQDRVIGAAGPGAYRAYRGWAGRPEYGNSLLVRETLPAADEERLELGLNRAAHRVRLGLPGGAWVVVAATHLHHVVGAAAERDEQARRLIDWLGRSPDADGLLVMGDFNADPREPAYARMVEAGFRSAHREANGDEPPVTWPSGLVAPAMDTDGEPACLDYIWVRGSILVESCRLAFDRPATDDPTLYPSDHLCLSAHLAIG